MKNIPLNCPNCGGKMEMDTGRALAICPYCESKVFIPGAVTPPHPAAPPPGPAYVPPAPERSTTGANAVVGCIALLLITIFVIVSIVIATSEDGCGSRANNPSAIQPPTVTPDSIDRAISAKDFIFAAEKAGYFIIIEDDYDRSFGDGYYGFAGYWAGAHLFAEDAAQKESNEIFVINYYGKHLYNGADLAFVLYAQNVMALRGNANSGKGSNYEFQVNSS